MLIPEVVCFLQIQSFQVFISDELFNCGLACILRTLRVENQKKFPADFLILFS
jgi:hypothetical protein